MNQQEIENLRAQVEAIASDAMYGDLPFIHPAGDGKILPRELLKLIDIATTTESQITSGKAESIDSPQFRSLLALVEIASEEVDSGQVEPHHYDTVLQTFIAHIEAVREKDIKELKHALWCAEVNLVSRHEHNAELTKRAEKTEAELANVKACLYARNTGLAGAEAERDHFKAIAERQAPDLSKLKRYDFQGNSEYEACRVPSPTGEYVEFDDVQALLSPAQQEPARMGCLTCGADRLKERCKREHWQDCPMTGEAQSRDGTLTNEGTKAASATDAGQAKVRAGYAHCNCDPNVTKYCDGNCYDPAQATPEGGQDLQQVMEFLLGEGDLGGKWFGDRDEGQPKYWWRNNLRAALAAQQNSASNSSNTSASQQTAEPVAWHVKFDEFRHFSGAMTAGREYVQAKKPDLSGRFFEGCDSLVVTPLYRAAPLQQVEKDN